MALAYSYKEWRVDSEAASAVTLPASHTVGAIGASGIGPGAAGGLESRLESGSADPGAAGPRGVGGRAAGRRGAAGRARRAAELADWSPGPGCPGPQGLRRLGNFGLRTRGEFRH